MFKKLLITALVIGGVVFVARKTHIASYARTFYSQVRSEAKASVPTKFELERIRTELAQLDQDISKMIRPVAEYKVFIDQLRQEIEKGEAKLQDQRSNLLAVVKELDANPKYVSFGGTKMNAERVRAKLAREFETFKTAEKVIESKRSLLEAKEASLASSQEQLVKVIERKKDYESRLADLEAVEERLVAREIGASVQVDTTRASTIEEALKAVEHRQKVRETEVLLRNGPAGSVFSPLSVRPDAPVDLDTIRQHLQNPAESTASNR